MRLSKRRIRGKLPTGYLVKTSSVIMAPCGHKNKQLQTKADGTHPSGLKTTSILLIKNQICSMAITEWLLHCFTFSGPLGWK